MRKRFLLLILTILFINNFIAAQSKWYESYRQGVEFLKIGDYNSAVVKLQAALHNKDEDKKRIRTYGMHFIEYYPNRELGIAFFYLGNLDRAEEYLNISKNQVYTERAGMFLEKVREKKASTDGKTPLSKEENKKAQQNLGKRINPLLNPATPTSSLTAIEVKRAKEKVGEKTIRRVGDRMTIAVFPFESKGEDADLGSTVMDKLTTALFNQNRFRVIERSQLERVLEEQKLGMTGILDVSQAARLGKGIGVDAIIIGSATKDAKGEVGISARAIDTESGIIVVAEDAFAPSSDVKMLKGAIGTLSMKFVQNIPLVQGMVISIENNSVMIDKGRTNKLRKGMKCVVYKEGKEIRHPVSNAVLGKEVIILGEVLLTEISDLYSYAKVLKLEPGQTMSVENLFVTK